MINKELEKLDLSPADCKKIQERHSDRVAKTVIQAIYTITDVSFDPPAESLLRKLVQAAIELKNIALGVTSSIPDIDKVFCLNEAEMLIRAARQRLANIPSTRDEQRLPFELPPPGVRVYYEACEYVIKSVLQLFERPLPQRERLLESGEKHPYSFYYPYVIFDSFDNPKHTGLAVAMPEDSRTSLEVYTALSHEAFHSFLAQSKFMKAHRDSCAATNSLGPSITSIPHSRFRLIEEIFAETLDLNFTYLNNFNEYILNEWSFFANAFRDTLKEKLEDRGMMQYILRTLSVRILKEALKRQVPPNELLTLRHEIRRLKNEHIKIVLKIIGKQKIDADLTFFYNEGHYLQNDLDALAENMTIIYEDCKGLIEQYETKLEQLRIFTNDAATDVTVDKVIRGQVVNEKIRFPHLFVHKIANRFNGLDRKPDEMRCTLAMILSLWNSKNLVGENQP